MALLKINRFAQDSVNMDMKLLIDNPLPVGVKLDDLNFKFYIAGVEVVKSRYEKTIDLDGSDRSFILLPVTLYKEKLTAILKKLENKNVDSTEYRVEGTTNISVLGIKKNSWQFNFSKILPLFIIPKPAVEKISLDKLRWKHSRLVITLSVENGNAFPMRFKETKYSVKMDNDRLASGQIDSIINIPAKGTGVVEIPSDVSIGQAIEALYDNWFHSSTTHFEMNLETKIVSDDNSIKDSQVIWVIRGNLKDVKK